MTSKFFSLLIFSSLLLTSASIPSSMILHMICPSFRSSPDCAGTKLWDDEASPCLRGHLWLPGPLLDVLRVGPSLGFLIGGWMLFEKDKTNRENSLEETGLRICDCLNFRRRSL
jgi:hypothetical protein